MELKTTERIILERKRKRGDEMERERVLKRSEGERKGMLNGRGTEECVKNRKGTKNKGNKTKTEGREDEGH